MSCVDNNKSINNNNSSSSSVNALQPSDAKIDQIRERTLSIIREHMPYSYPRFLPTLAKSIKAGGWLMTADKTVTMETINPEDCLLQSGLKFNVKKSQETRLFEELLLVTPISPMRSVPTLDHFKRNQRQFRMSGTDYSYWAHLILRQKV